MRAILAVEPRARFVHCEPLISIVADPLRPNDRLDAEGARLAQFQACDMISGRMWPQIGGSPELLDIVGVNYYCDRISGSTAARQWRQIIHCTSPSGYCWPRPTRDGCLILVAETGTEGEGRAVWFVVIASDVMAARTAGIPVEGICLYPIIDHVGWDNDRDCPSGLLENRFRGGARPVHQPLADAIDPLLLQQRVYLRSLAQLQIHAAE